MLSAALHAVAWPARDLGRVCWGCCRILVTKPSPSCAGGDCVLGGDGGDAGRVLGVPQRGVDAVAAGGRRGLHAVRAADADRPVRRGGGAKGVRVGRQRHARLDLLPGCAAAPHRGDLYV